MNPELAGRIDTVRHGERAITYKGTAYRVVRVMVEPDRKGGIAKAKAVLVHVGTGKTLTVDLVKDHRHWTVFF